MTMMCVDCQYCWQSIHIPPCDVCRLRNYNQFVPIGCLRVTEERGIMKQECPSCGNKMKEGVLPGWWLCESCLFFLDVQD